MNIGVLALQGDFAEHIKVLRRLGVDAQEVRLPHELDALDGLIIPGGESTNHREIGRSLRSELSRSSSLGQKNHYGALVPGRYSFQRMRNATSLCWV